MNRSLLKFLFSLTVIHVSFWLLTKYILLIGLELFRVYWFYKFWYVYSLISVFFVLTFLNGYIWKKGTRAF